MSQYDARYILRVCSKTHVGAFGQLRSDQNLQPNRCKVKLQMGGKGPKNGDFGAISREASVSSYRRQRQRHPAHPPQMDRCRMARDGRHKASKGSAGKMRTVPEPRNVVSHKKSGKLTEVVNAGPPGARPDVCPAWVGTRRRQPNATDSASPSPFSSDVLLLSLPRTHTPRLPRDELNGSRTYPVIVVNACKAHVSERTKKNHKNNANNHNTWSSRKFSQSSDVLFRLYNPRPSTDKLTCC